MSNLVPVSWRNSVDDLRRSVLDTIDRWLPQRFRREGSPDDAFWPGTLLMAGGPAVDVAEDDHNVMVTAEMPGLDKKDFTLEVEGDRLVLRGEKKAAREEKNRSYYYSECAYGSFARAIPLPCEVDVEKADATYKHGVLRVKLPKTEAAKARRITVSVN